MSDPFIGEIMAVGFYFDANGFKNGNQWMPCDGRSLPIQQFSALFSLIGTTYGGNGTTTFNLPNLNGTSNGTVAISQGTGPGLTNRVIGQTVGSMTETLTVQEMPWHTHGLRLGPNGTTGATSGPGQPGASVALDPGINGFAPAPADTQLSANAIAYQGGGQPHPNDQPTTGLWYCIAVTGIFPSFG
jgi:microcystin-dependent protein